MNHYWHGIVAACLLCIATVGQVDAQTGKYPNRAVQIIADSSAGSAPDVGLRFAADRLTKIWNQQVTVANHPGAGGSLAARLASQATPDGYTFYQPVLSTFVALRKMGPNVPLQVPRDFLPVGFVTETPMFFAVSPTLGISTLPELIALAKKRPGAVSYATTGVGRLTHLTGELLQHQAGIDLLLVPYTGGPAHAVGDVATGRVSMIIEGYSGIVGAVRAGSIKLIAVATAERLPDFPQVPTVAETIPGFVATGWAMLVAPLGTPEPIINKVSGDLQKVVAEPELRKKLANLGSYTHPMSPRQATDFIHQQQAMWNPVLAEIAKKMK